MIDKEESSLMFHFPDDTTVRKFDDNTHGLTCMKAVDFIMEFPNGDAYFIEVKNINQPGADEMRQMEFRDKIDSTLEALKYKYRDSFLYEWARGKEYLRIYFYVLLEGVSSEPHYLMTLTDGLKQRLPSDGAKGGWTRNIVYNVAIFNVDSWNRKLPQIPIDRLYVTA